MSTDPKTPAKPAAPAAPAKPDDAKAAKPATAPKEVSTKPPPLDERKLKLAELAPHAAALNPAEIIPMLVDGRAIVRANAALALAATGTATAEMVPLLRDSDLHVAVSAAESVATLGRLARPFAVPIAAALDSAPAEVVDSVVTTLADWIGSGGDELIPALDVTHELAQKSVNAAAGKAGKPGIAFLIRAAASERIRIRMNAVAGLGRFGKLDFDTAMAFLTGLETTDPVPDVRQAVKQAMLAVVAREKTVAVDHLPKNIPDFEERKLSASELSEYADQIDVNQMIYALQDGRDYVRVNGARALGVKGAKAAPAASQMGLLLRDSNPSVRREVAKALGKLGAGAVDAAPDLVGALGDGEIEVAEAAYTVVQGLGEAAREALVKGLETGNEAGGQRVGDLLGQLPRGADSLTDAFGSPAVNVQVNAALGLGLLKDKCGARGLAALHGARTGGDARTRAAVRRALDQIEPPVDKGPKPAQIAGYEERLLSAADLEKQRPELERLGVGDFVKYLEDGREVVRANAATALGLLGAPAVAAASTLGVRLRDDSPAVRMAAATALDKIGDAAVLEAADDLVGALGDTDEKVATTVAGIVRARKARMIPALVKGLETDKPSQGRRVGELISVFEDASNILVDAIASPAVNTQVMAALALGMLGKNITPKGRKALEDRRTGADVRTREAVRSALDTIDGPRRTGPGEIPVEGFEQRFLAPEAFADPKVLKVEDLTEYLQDGRPHVRANAATGLGAVGAPGALAAVGGMGVLMRDDDMKVRIAAAHALDKIGDDAVRAAAPSLVGALRGDAEVAKVVAKVLAARKTRVLTALVKGYETDDETHGRRISELINALPDPCEILCDAFESPAENVKVNVALGIGMLGAKRAGTQGRKLLEGHRTGGYARVREAVFRALAMLDS
jgi:HEAT repeat protein